MYCTLNTHKLDVNCILGNQIGLNDFLFAHVRGQPKEVTIRKERDSFGMTLTDTGCGVVFIKRIHPNGLMDHVTRNCGGLIEVGDQIERIDQVMFSGRRHYEVAEYLKSIPIGASMLLRLISPERSPIYALNTRGHMSTSTTNLASGKRTIRFRSDGVVEERAVVLTEVELIHQINYLLGTNLGFEDDQLGLWLEWIEDERKLATTDEEKKEVGSLFLRAVEDYDDPSIWLEYCLFTIGNIQPGSSDSVRDTENVFETALSHQGLNVASGHNIWDVYREFQSIMMSHQSVDPYQSTDEQVKKMDKLYRRQLRLPQIVMQNTLEAYREFLSTSGESLYPSMDRTQFDTPPDCTKEYELALAQLQLLRPFEDRIEEMTESPEAESVSAWETYLDWIVAFPARESHPPTRARRGGGGGNTGPEPFSPNHICCLFERAVTTHCLQPTIWLRFLNYLEEKLSSDKQRVLRVMARSVRNCPWSGDLWLRYAQFSECWVVTDLLQASSNGTSAGECDRSAEHAAFSKVEVVFSAAFSAGLTEHTDVLRIWLAFCDYRLRRLLRVERSTGEWNTLLTDLRLTFEQADAELHKLFNQHQADPDGVLAQYQALVEAKHAGDLGSARSLWSRLMQQPGHGCQARFWLAYLQFERNWGDAKHFFRLARMAINSITTTTTATTTTTTTVDQLDSTYAAISRLAAELGLSVVQCSELEARMRSRRVELRLRESERPSTADEPNPVPAQVSPFDAEGKSGKKRSRTLATIPDQPTAKKSKFGESKLPSSNTNAEEKADKPKKTTPILPQRPHGEIVTHDASKDDRTVFVSNLDYSITEDQLRTTFEQCGELTSVRLVCDYAGRSKGFAYVEFNSVQSVPAALAKDREPVSQSAEPVVEGDETKSTVALYVRPMFVSRCDPNRSGNAQFKYAVGKQEPEKLFIRNLDRQCTQHALEELFGQYGKVVSVRLAVYRNGSPKGHAYVDFSNAEDASRALIATDGLLVGSKNLAVSISNPPVRREKQTGGDSHTRNATDTSSFKVPGAPATTEVTRTHSKTQLSMLPRAINRSNMANRSEKSVQEVPKPEADTKSNADFRRMFLP